MPSLYDLIDASAQLVKRIPIRSIKEIPLVIPVDYPAGNFNPDRGNAVMDGDMYRTAGYATLANNAFTSLYVYSPNYPFVLWVATFAVSGDAEVENQLFEKGSLPSDLTQDASEPVNVNRWKYWDATSYVEIGTKSTVTTGDKIASWVASATPYVSIRYVCAPGYWYILEMTNIGTQTYDICYDIYVQEQIKGHESAT